MKDVSCLRFECNEIPQSGAQHEQMNKKEAYERLELPEGSDLQIVRKKFVALYNDFQTRIDNAPTARLRQVFETEQQKLKEAYASLNERDNGNDSGRRPGTEKPFDSAQRVAREPKWWYAILTVLMVLTGLYLLATLILGQGRSWGYSAQAVCWTWGTVLSCAVVLNHFSPKIVPPYLRRKWFQGLRGILVLLSVLVIASLLVNIGYSEGAKKETIQGIRWSHYIDIGTYMMIAAHVTWSVFMGIMLIIGLANPGFFYFKQRRMVFTAFLLMLLGQYVLITCLGIAAPRASQLEHHENDLGLLGKEEWRMEG